jgi:hypothetical protein
VAAIALVGDCTTTTALALAAAWPSNAPAGDSTEHDLIVVEVDPRGGSLAAWLDTPLSPSLSTVVTALHHGASTGATSPTMWNTIDAMIRRSASGVRFIPAPFRSIEARRAVAEAERTLLPLLAATTNTIALLDGGDIDPGRPPAACQHADITVVCHRLDSSSASAATVRLERLAERVESLRNGGHDVAVAVIGDEPFPLDEVLDFAAPGTQGWQIAVDPLAAAVFAGRTGVSERRLGRLPLVRSASRVASDLAVIVGSSVDSNAHRRSGSPAAATTRPQTGLR